jgi:hypothetical protein
MHYPSLCYLLPLQSKYFLRQLGLKLLLEEIIHRSRSTSLPLRLLTESLHLCHSLRGNAEMGVIVTLSYLKVLYKIGHITYVQPGLYLLFFVLKFFHLK